MRVISEIMQSCCYYLIKKVDSNGEEKMNF